MGFNVYVQLITKSIIIFFFTFVFILLFYKKLIKILKWLELVASKVQM